MPDTPEPELDRVAGARFAERMRALVDEAGGNRRFAELTGLPQRTLANYLGGQEARGGTLLRIAQATGRSIEWLLGSDQASVVAETGMDGELVAVPRLFVRASAGPGRAVVSGEGEGASELAFRRSWLRSLGVAPQNAEFVQAEGDSMEPTIRHGDLMLVDRGYGDVVNGKIYVLVVRGLVLVKRLHVLAIGGLMLLSDNERYPTETIGRSEVNDLNIEARVVWYGRAL